MSGVSICPVVSYSGSPLYSLLNKYIPNFARDVKDENNNVKNPTMFANYIRNAPIEIEVMMVWFDITYNWCTKHNQGLCNNDDQFPRKKSIPQDKFLHLLNFALTSTWYTFICQFY